MAHPRIALVVLSAWAAVISASARGDVSKAERIAAQRALERIAWEHRLGDKLPFEQAAPPAAIEAKVERYLRESAALERIWGDTIDAYRMQRELARMARGSRLPGRLREIFDALRNDPVLLQECLARPALVGREIRSRYAWDPALHAATRALAESAASTEGRVVERDDAFVVEVEGDPSRSRAFPKASFEAWWSAHAAEFDPTSVHGAADASLPLPPLASKSAGDSCADDSWDGGLGSTGTPAWRFKHVAVWTGSEMIVWAGVGAPIQSPNGAKNDGARYDPAIDSWRPIATPALEARWGATGVWTGSRMIVWGGGHQVTNIWILDADGGIYDPVADAWTPIATSGAPSARIFPASVWTGSALLVFGGQQAAPPPAHGLTTIPDGKRYDPGTNSWTAIAASPVTNGTYTSAAWLSGRMWIWDNGQGAGYDPAGNGWVMMPASGAPSQRTNAALVATDHEVAVWGGQFTTLLNDGALFDPALNSWRPFAAAGAPPPLSVPRSVWTGRGILIVGSYTPGGALALNGGLYDPAGGAWSPLELRGAPSPRDEFTLVWTGKEAILWGDDNAFNDAKRYDPLTRRWSPVDDGSPISQQNQPVVWTGSEMIVLGFVQGQRYDPVTDTWLATSSIGAPASPSRAVWAGNVVVAWGGSNFSSIGGRYDPASDVWSPITTSGAPSLRSVHAMISTGPKAIVWGGSTSTGSTNTGAIYDPATDTWTATSTVNAPAARFSTSAVWTGSRMIVWGGNGANTSVYLGDGASYDPATDSWVPLSSTGAPSARNGHVAVWTGSQMVIWGGFDGAAVVATGARYTPATDQWSPTSTLGVAASSGAAAAWTGHVMVEWGGAPVPPSAGAGGRYDPAADTWTPMTTVGAPAGRTGHGLVWTGSLALVWGGGPSAGGRYVLGASTDDDGDGFTDCQGDCNDGDATVWSRPQEADGIAIGADKTTLSWSPAVSGSVAPPVYTVFRSPRPDLFTASACVAKRIASTSTSDLEVPLPGQAFYYLVGAANGCTRFTDLGSESDASPRFGTCGP